jgi:hypothetical protein
MSAYPVSYQRPQFRQIRLPIRRQATRREAYSIATHLKIYFALVSTCGLLVYAFWPPVALVLSGVLIGMPLLALGIIEARRGSIWLNPLSLFLLYLGMQLGPAAIWKGIKFLSDDSLNFPSLRISAGDVATGYFITLVGTCVMSLGLRALRPDDRSRAADQFAEPIGWKPHWIFLLYVAGIAAIYRPKTFLFLGMFGGVLQCGCLAVLLNYAFSTNNVHRLPSRVLFAAGVAVYVLASFLGDSSSKSYTMLAFLPAIAFFGRHPKYRKWIPAGAILLAILYLGVVAPAVNNSRNMKGKDSYDRITAGLYSSSPFYTGDSLIRSLQGQFDGLMGRLFEMPPVAGFMVNEVKRSGFQLGGTMGVLHYAFIPRIAWSGKPLVSRGAWFTTYLRMAPREAEATTSTGMTIVGEWYWNFGVAGVVVGMFLTGVLLSGLWRLAGRYPIHQPAKMVLYVALIVNVLNLPDATSPIVSAVALYLLFGSLIFLRRFGQRITTTSNVTRIRSQMMRASNQF